jgi:mRNA-degrading endonuclease RelE of RelBE toxin-antitoxin system
MDRLQKFIHFNPQYQTLVNDACDQILIGNFENLDIKPLQGKKHEYRCRIGKIRITYFNNGTTIAIIDVDFRGNIYK